MEKKDNGTGIGFIGFLTLLFIALKLLDKITWSWVWVLSPLWITAIMVLVVMVVALIVTNRRLK